MAKLKVLQAWSFSRFATYEDCPQKIKFSAIDRIKEPEATKGAAAARGTDIHTLGEEYLKGKRRTLPTPYKPFAEEMKRLKRLKAIAEGDITLRKDWSLTRWDDWNGAWLRIKIDALAMDGGVLDIVDFKTGKVRDKNRLQLELYAIGGLIKYPEAVGVRSRLLYLDSAEIIEENYGRAALPMLQKLWLKRTKPMLTDTRFKPTPNYSCRWCFYRKSNAAAGGGQCEF